MNLIGEKDNKIQIHKNPFSKNFITDVRIFFTTSFEAEWRASVVFKNGDTKGEQTFKVMGAEGFQNIVTQVQTFINSLD